MTHFLQRPAWAAFQESIGHPVVHRTGEGWSYYAFLESGKLGKRLYAPYGPVLETPDALKPALDSLIQEGKKLGAAYVRVEPTGSVDANMFSQLRLRRVRRKQPEHTQRIDLQRPFTEILADMQSSLRNRHRNYHKKGVSIRKSSDPTDVEHLIRLLGDVTDRTGMDGHDHDYLRANAASLIPQGAAAIYLAEYEGEVIATSFIFEDEQCRYYAHAAADTEHRKLHPGPVLVSQMIEDAAAEGKKFFDLYGVVPPEVTDHPWSGFSNFKRSFGGEQHDYAGTWELPLKPLTYGVYTLVHRFLHR